MQIFKNLLLHMHVDKNFVLVLFVFLPEYVTKDWNLQIEYAVNLLWGLVPVASVHWKAFFFCV